MRARMQPWTWPVVVTGVAVALCAGAGPARAFGVDGLGGRLGYSSPENLDGTAAMGVHADLAERGTHLHLQPNMMFWSVDGTSDVSPNMDAYYHFRGDRRVSPYVGGGVGLNFIHNDSIDRSNTDVGMNLVGGLRFPGGGNRYFVEGRYTASDVPQVSLMTGITFHAP